MRCVFFLLVVCLQWQNRFYSTRIIWICFVARYSAAKQNHFGDRIKFTKRNAFVYVPFAKKNFFINLFLLYDAKCNVSTFSSFFPTLSLSLSLFQPFALPFIAQQKRNKRASSEVVDFTIHISIILTIEKHATILTLLMYV